MAPMNSVKHDAPGRSTKKSTSSFSKEAKLASSSRSKSDTLGTDGGEQSRRSHTAVPSSTTTTVPGASTTNAAEPAAAVVPQLPQDASQPAGGDGQFQWPLRVPASRTITKTLAKDQYRVNEDELRELQHREKWNARNPSRPIHLYRERDVEHKALERHGGPEGFLRFLRKLYRTHTTSKKTTSPFQQPDDYRVADPYDAFLCKSPKLRGLQFRLPRWLWKACNQALDNVVGGRFTEVREREEAISRVEGNFARSYPGRPAVPLPPSPTVDALRHVLEAAPRLPPRAQWGKPADGLELISRATPNDNSTAYEWSPEYRGRLFAALDALRQAYGTGSGGWATARWEVYEKYCERMSAGVAYDSQNPQPRWFDNAAKWLDEEYLLRGIKDHAGAMPGAVGNA